MGSQHLLTFDGHTLSFRGSCDYLLARDFVNENFTLIMRHTNASNTGQFLLTHIMPDYTLTIDIFNDVSALIHNSVLYMYTSLNKTASFIRKLTRLPFQQVILPHGESLPSQLGHVYVYREKGVITIEERDGYKLECNVMFQVCTLSLSGELNAEGIMLRVAKL